MNVDNESLPLYVSAPTGVAVLLRAELRELGARKVRLAGAGCSALASLSVIYKVCLWSRCASRVLLELTRFDARDSDALYAGVAGLDWPGLFALEATFAVRATLRDAAIAHSGFAAQRVKDAVVDVFRQQYGERPSVDRRSPDITLHLHMEGRAATLSLDLAGQSLHRRGWRSGQGAAPIKENLAAALLMRAGWRALAARGCSLVDPMCGSGTLLIEGLLDAAQAAPGLARERFGFSSWRGHDETLWQEQRRMARAQARLDEVPPAFGYDIDMAAVRLATEAADRAGIGERLVLEQRALDEAVPPPGAAAGLLITNPPYGERLGGDELPGLYSQLGQAIRRFGGWQAFVFSGNPGLVHRLRLHPRQKFAMYNGSIPCTLLDLGTVTPEPGPGPGVVVSTESSADDDPFANRLRKNRRNLDKWARRHGITCYRLYDADLPDYAFAVDYYGGPLPALVVQEYAPPARIDEGRAAERRRHALDVLSRDLELPPERVYFRTRQRQRSSDQYERLSQHRQFEEVSEGELRFAVNFTDYLDCGLFIDHRQTRARLRAVADGRRFLNLFCYTGSATVYAAAGGATDTTSVDLSRTYLDWTRRNLALNDLDSEQHVTVRADCLGWIAQQVAQGQQWQLIFVDPPSFSNSSAMPDTFDVQRDHATLLARSMSLLSDDGLLLFSTNRRQFKLDQQLPQSYQVDDITRDTLPRDFTRRGIHRCWEFRHRSR